MRTRILEPGRETDLRTAADVLVGGGLLAFPTETVYGLGTRADTPDAVARLLKVKGRPAEKKMAILVSGIDDAMRYVSSVPEPAVRIARRFWPGPVTLVMDGADGEAIGLRCPRPGFVRDLVAMVGAPVFAPSANPAGAAPAINAAEVLDYFNGKIDAVLDGGETAGRAPSTVVRVTGSSVEIIRAGAVRPEEIMNL